MCQTYIRRLKPYNWPSFVRISVPCRMGGSSALHSFEALHLPEELVEGELVDVGVVRPELVEVFDGVDFILTGEAGEVAFGQWLILQGDVHRDLQVAGAVHIGFDVVLDEVEHPGDCIALLLLLRDDRVLEGDGVLALAVHTGHGTEVDGFVTVADEALGHVALELHGFSVHEGRIRLRKVVALDGDLDAADVVVQFIDDVDGAGHVAVDREAAEDAGHGLHRVVTGLRVVIAVHPCAGEVVDFGADRVRVLVSNGDLGHGVTRYLDDVDAVVRGVLCDEEDTVGESDLRDVAVVLERALVIDAEDEPGLDSAVPFIMYAVVVELVEVEEVRARGGVAVHGVAEGAVGVLRAVDVDKLRLVRLLLCCCGLEHLCEVVGVEGDALEAELAVGVLGHAGICELLVCQRSSVLGPVDRVVCIGRLCGFTRAVLADRPGGTDGGDTEKRADEDAHRAAALVAKLFLRVVFVFHILSYAELRGAAG